MSASQAARQRGAAYVEARGDELSRRSVAVLVGAKPLPDLLGWLADRQRGDGSVARGPGDSATGGLAAARLVLGVLDDLGALDSVPAQRLCAHLNTVQAADGHWGDGSEDERIFVTGMLAGHLAKSRFARRSLLEAAGGYLGARWSSERVRSFQWHALAAYAHFFASVSDDLSDEILQWCGRELERGFRTGRFDAVRTVRVLAWCGAPVLPGARIAPGELGGALLAAQADDGGWLEPGRALPAERVAHTFDALVGLGLLGAAADASPRG